MRMAAKVLWIAGLSLMLPAGRAWSLGQPSYVSTSPVRGSFALAQGRDAAPLLADPADWPGVLRAVADLQADVRRVTNLTPAVVKNGNPAGRTVVIIGTIGRSAVIDRLIREKKIDASAIAGKWESFFLETVANPMPGITSFSGPGRFAPR